jgi:kynurenine formamidase
MPVRILSLSYPVSAETPTYGNLPKPKIMSHTSIAAGNTSNTYAITVYNHTGTHVDAPAHFVPNGKRICDYSPEELIFRRPLLVDIPKGPGEWVEEENVKKAVKLRDADCLLIRTGFGALRGQDLYKTNNPGISPEAILWLRRELQKIRCIGIDSISISGFQDRPRGRMAHLAAFEKHRGRDEPLLLLEDVNLSALKAGIKIQKITVVPWSISGVDSAPCTVLAEVVRHE